MMLPPPSSGLIQMLMNSSATLREIATDFPFGEIAGKARTLPDQVESTVVTSPERVTQMRSSFNWPFPVVYTRVPDADTARSADPHSPRRIPSTTAVGGPVTLIVP